MWRKFKFFPILLIPGIVEGRPRLSHCWSRAGPWSWARTGRRGPRGSSSPGPPLLVWSPCATYTTTCSSTRPQVRGDNCTTNYNNNTPITPLTNQSRHADRFWKKINKHFSPPDGCERLEIIAEMSGPARNNKTFLGTSGGSSLCPGERQEAQED